MTHLNPVQSQDATGASAQPKELQVSPASQRQEISCLQCCVEFWGVGSEVWPSLLNIWMHTYVYCYRYTHMQSLKQRYLSCLLHILYYLQILYESYTKINILTIEMILHSSKLLLFFYTFLSLELSLQNDSLIQMGFYHFICFSASQYVIYFH